MSKAAASPAPISRSRRSSRTSRPSRSFIARSSQALKADALLATNTSSIPLDELRTALRNPQRFLGLHYFNPVAQMPLVEIVRHDQLDAANEKRALAFCKAIGKLPVPVKGTPGFLVNRILMPYLLEAMRMYQEGVPGPVLDKAAKKFGMPMGPIELADTVGLDVAASVGKELGAVPRTGSAARARRTRQGGKRGKKDGQGFYTWENGKPKKPEVDPNYVAPDDLQDRMILPMLNEAVACLPTRVVDDADLLDAGVIFGTGFAPFRGGPIQYIRDTGADALKAKLEALAQRHGDRFKPRPGWDSPRIARAVRDAVGKARVKTSLGEKVFWRVDRAVEHRRGSVRISALQADPARSLRPAASMPGVSESRTRRAHRRVSAERRCAHARRERPREPAAHGADRDVRERRHRRDRRESEGRSKSRHRRRHSRCAATTSTCHAH